MTHEQASERCAELNRQGGAEHWFPRETPDGDWEIVSVAVDGFRPRDPLKETTEARPEPRDEPDPRPSIFRNIPPFGPG